MLKLLLGHWKAHRKKPSLLPEDGDIHFEDPSTINPLFEDSDSSISSTKRPTNSESQEQTEIEPHVENKQNQNETGVPIVNNELIDISIPTHSKDSVISDITVPKDDVTDTEKDKISLATETVSEAENVEKDKPSENLESTVANQNPVSLEFSSNDDSLKNISSKDETETVETGIEEKMRIYNQPSTSAITESKKYTNAVSNEKEKTPLSILNSTNVKKVDRVENRQNEPSINKNNKSNSNKTQSSSSPLKKIKENSPPSKLFQSTNEPEKSAKLRGRAIDELIKKFQGSSTEKEDVANISKTEKEDSLNQPTETERIVNNVTKPENKNISSPSTETNKDAHKITKSETKELSKTTKPKIQTDAPNKKGQEIEALSNIFKFPPPPPLEHLPNQSSLHGKIMKELKVNNSALSSNKVKENSDTSRENDPGKTRSDSSLERTRTTSSSKPKVEIDDKKEIVSKIQEQSFKELSQQTLTDPKTSVKDVSLELNNGKEIKKENETLIESKNTNDIKHPVESMVENKKKTKTIESGPQTSHNSASIKKESPVSNHKTETASNFLRKNSVTSRNIQKNVLKSPVKTHKSSISKASSKLYSANDNENVKSHSEDSGITRGDQISSETTQETPLENPPEETNVAPNAARKNKKEKKLKSVHKKNCRHAHDDSISIKRSQYDDYYDGLTGARHMHKSRHSDSWTSDLSWEEKEFLRRLRSRRGTVRSNTPSTRSRHSKYRFLDENYFRRHHNFRRSLSDDSSFYGASLCSCDECWAMYIKDYAYGRTSLRGMSPIQEMCTCRNSRHNFLGRRVQFRSDPIHEAASLSERTTRTATPAPPPAEKKQEDEADVKSSQKSSKSKEGDSVSTHPEGIKDKKAKIPEEAYRFVTPWELEEWDLIMRKHLLQRRRRRARCMGIMALAMVVFVGLVVTILMVYLRRKVI